VRMKHLVGLAKRCGDGHPIRRHHRKAHENVGALIGAALRVASEGSVGGTVGGRGAAQKIFQPLVKCDGNCNEIPVKAW
jgi:hypothetical protein